MADLKTTSATTGDANVEEYRERTTKLLHDIFRDDPVHRYFFSSLDDTTRHAFMHEYLCSATKAATLNDAVLEESSDWSCVSVWMPPGKAPDGPCTVLQCGILQLMWKLGFAGMKKMLWDYQGATTLKSKELGDSKYWYLFFVATIAEARGQGLASRVVERHKELAREDGVPIWLEASTEKSRDVYLRCGFKVVGEELLGKGTHAASGEEQKGGPGVRAWGMVWWPEKYGGKAGKESVVVEL